MSLNEVKDQRLLDVWNQKDIPVLFRKGKGFPLLFRPPYANDNRAWIKFGHKKDPTWNEKRKCWEIPKAWFEDTIRKSLARYSRIYVIQPVNRRETCAPACWNAVGAECECSCLGERHGSGEPIGRWHVVSETFAVTWGPKEYSCRLLTPIAALNIHSG